MFEILDVALPAVMELDGTFNQKATAASFPLKP